MKYKFRAWLKNAKKMVDVTEINFKEKFIKIDEPYYPKINFCGIAIPFDQIELMQYTGLKDKNGIEIYEGDIVKGFSRNAVVKIGFPHNEKNHSYGVYAEWTKYKLQEVQYINNYVFENLEVIGNIFKNKELLND